MGDSLDVARRFGANLRRVRKQVDLSQEQLGFQSGLHRTEVGLLERGARVPASTRCSNSPPASAPHRVPAFRGNVLDPEWCDHRARSIHVQAFGGAARGVDRHPLPTPPGK